MLTLTLVCLHINADTGLSTFWASGHLGSSASIGSRTFGQLVRKWLSQGTFGTNSRDSLFHPCCLDKTDYLSQIDKQLPKYGYHSFTRNF